MTEAHKPGTRSVLCNRTRVLIDGICPCGACVEMRGRESTPQAPSSTPEAAGASEGPVISHTENVATTTSSGERKNSAAHRAFMRAWHSTRLSCDSEGELDRHALRLAEYADEQNAKLCRRNAQIVELHDAVCRPNQPADHDFFGCALEGIHDWESALNERQAEIDRLKAALRPCIVALDSLVHVEQGDPLSPPGPIARALAGARGALDEADEPMFVMNVVEVGE